MQLQTKICSFCCFEFGQYYIILTDRHYTLPGKNRSRKKECLGHVSVIPQSQHHVNIVSIYAHMLHKLPCFTAFPLFYPFPLEMQNSKLRVQGEKPYDIQDHSRFFNLHPHSTRLGLRPAASATISTTLSVLRDVTSPVIFNLDPLT